MAVREMKRDAGTMRFRLLTVLWRQRSHYAPRQTPHRSKGPTEEIKRIGEGECEECYLAAAAPGNALVRCKARLRHAFSQTLSDRRIGQAFLCFRVSRATDPCHFLGAGHLLRQSLTDALCVCDVPERLGRIRITVPLFCVGAEFLHAKPAFDFCTEITLE
ncbi:hypothetical protein TNCV_4820841 [Trichonephila clavipes]|nr:hypothetical protein TNCV_4820841 [Trichonephila clavipes]